MNLDTATQFDEGTRWKATLIPGAGEMTAYHGGPARNHRRNPLCDPDVEKASRDRVRRARKSIRQYAVANTLNCLVTLTFAEESNDVGLAATQTTNALRRVGYKLPRSPYVWTLERGSRGGRLHAHVLVMALYAQYLEVAWVLGSVDVSESGSDFESLRKYAGYLAKDLELGPLMDRQSYRIAKGFVPEALRLIGGDESEALLRDASRTMGSSPSLVQGSRCHSAFTAFWNE